MATAEVLDSVVADHPLATVIALGDLAYPDGTPQQFACGYNPTWGRHYNRTKPAVGNHEYHTPVPPDTSDTGTAEAATRPRAGTATTWVRGTSWFSTTNCASIGGCEPGSPQHQWLAADLAANADILHSGIRAPSLLHRRPHDRSMVLRDFWELAYDQGVDLWLDGHDHNYQRFAPQDPDGNLDPQRGIPQFLVGSGGVGHTTPTRVGSNPNLAVENHDTYGIIELSLSQGGYDWEFHPEAGRTFTDTGTGNCHLRTETRPRRLTVPNQSTP